MIFDVLTHNKDSRTKKNVNEEINILAYKSLETVSSNCLHSRQQLVSRRLKNSNLKYNQLFSSQCLNLVNW